MGTGCHWWRFSDRVRSPWCPKCSTTLPTAYLPMPEHLAGVLARASAACGGAGGEGDIAGGGKGGDDTLQMAIGECQLAHVRVCAGTKAVEEAKRRLRDARAQLEQARADVTDRHEALHALFRVRAEQAAQVRAPTRPTAVLPMPVNAEAEQTEAPCAGSRGSRRRG